MPNTYNTKHTSPCCAVPQNLEAVVFIERLSDSWTIGYAMLCSKCHFINLNKESKRYLRSGVDQKVVDLALNDPRVFQEIQTFLTNYKVRYVIFLNQEVDANLASNMGLEILTLASGDDNNTKTASQNPGDNL